MGLFGYGKSKEQKILEIARRDLNDHLSCMMNNSDLNNVICRNEYAKRDIEDRLGAAFLQHQNICFSVWLGDRSGMLSYLVVGGYRQLIQDYISDCAGFTPKDEERIRSDFEDGCKATENDREGTKIVVADFLLRLSKEKSREWFITWLSDNFDVSTSEHINIGAALMDELEKIWKESEKLVRLHIS